MSCCSNTYNSLPCCCPPNSVTVTTTFPPCDGEECVEIVLTDCIIHDGISSPCVNVVPGQTYTQVLVNILNILCSTTTTTTTKYSGGESGYNNHGTFGIGISNLD